MVDQPSSRAAVARTTTPVITDNLYEAAFSTTGTQPQCGVAIARTITEALDRLADMLFLCDPAAPTTATITAFGRAQIVRTYTGTLQQVGDQIAAESDVVEDLTGPAGDLAARISTGDIR